MDSDLHPNANNESLQQALKSTPCALGSGGGPVGGASVTAARSSRQEGAPSPTPEQELLDKNEDYQLIASTLGVLRNQLQQAELDLNRLAQLRQEALDDPVLFVDKLRTRTYDRVPKPQRVATLPAIDWEKYFIGDPSAETDPSRHNNNRARTRTRSSHLSDVFSAGPANLGTPSGSPRASSFGGVVVMPGSEEAFEAGIPQNKSSDDRSHTFNVAWTEDEHVKRAKGGSSRVSGAYYTNPRFAGSRIASMSDDESGPSATAKAGLGIQIDPALKATDEYKELLQLQALVKGNKQPAAHAADPVHQGFTCDRCAAEPIVGVRWTCTECPADEQVDLCNECYGKGFTNG
ncbi:ZZ-type zinc finger-containing protein 3 [Geranomyces michiganensis]|nr:ZZ-type zinc finger-containing protein 3 [Geranomyces michiganensis]